MRAAATVVSYLTTLALWRARHLDALNADEANRRMLAAITDLHNTVAAREQTDHLLRLLQTDIGSGTFERRTQGRLQLALEDELGRDEAFGRQVTDVLNRIRAEEAQRSTSFLKDVTRAIKDQEGLKGAVRLLQDYTRAGLAPALIVAAGILAVTVTVIAGGVTVINRAEEPASPQPTPNFPVQGTTTNGQPDPAVTPDLSFGPITTIQTPEGFKYQIQATSLSWQSQVGSEVAPPGKGFVSITVRATNLLPGTPAPDPLLDESASVGFLFPESSKSSTGDGCPAGLPVLEVSARGRPVGRCFEPVTVDTVRTDLTAVDDEAVLAPAGSRDLVLTSDTSVPSSGRLDDIEFWAQVGGTGEFTALPLP
ncbi:hypothetical protein KIH74_22360 [Kineosporia sp. J2-2]|uniref:DUF5667 domain-containing protein n=1 Tax=Kineosporia corallincola TaxID=2835133 RepID=A0ABS5TL12_9ACTN|nr:hypothetical protein [Kineosporia corallincola]MBT0771700.1 hypothetical protein [Kineosporia corallincola]